MANLNKLINFYYFWHHQKTVSILMFPGKIEINEFVQIYLVDVPFMSLLSTLSTISICLMAKISACNTSIECFYYSIFAGIFLSLHKKMKFFTKDLYSRCDQVPRKLRIWWHLLKESLMENFIFCAMFGNLSSQWKCI